MDVMADIPWELKCPKVRFFKRPHKEKCLSLVSRYTQTSLLNKEISLSLEIQDLASILLKEFMRKIIIHAYHAKKVYGRPRECHN